MISVQKHLRCKKKYIQELQVTVTITAIERSDIWYGTGAAKSDSRV